jgi:hypothetical protein
VIGSAPVLRFKGIFIGLGLILAITSVRGAVLHVRADAPGPETNGLSWATAFGSITQALKSASSGDELWVAAGTYKGAIQLPAGVALFGGFIGDETARTQRDWARNRSVIDWDEWTDIYPFWYYQFYPAVSLGDSSRLDGFTVINGWSSYGAAIYASESGAMIANNIIVTNRSTGILGNALLVDRGGEFDDSDDLFLKTANDFLRLQFSFGATNIPVAAYGPTVHRLLQVAANVYDAARSNVFPSVFRPQFASTPDGAVISGYYRDDSATTVDAWLATNPYGIPMIIGARKGFPNFNELSLQTAVLAARRLELRRMTTNSPPYQTNEMYIIGISNMVAVEAWNSYTQAFGYDLQMQVSNVCSYVLRTGDDLVHTAKSISAVSSHMAPAGWTGLVYPRFPDRPINRISFKVPLFTNEVILSNSALRFEPPILESTNALFQAGSGFRVPEWRLSISNRLTFLLSSGGRIVDFVHATLTNSTDLTCHLFGNLSGPSEGIIARCWNTNRPTAGIHVPTEGIQMQIDISLGNPAISTADWKNFSFDTFDTDAAIHSFREFCRVTLNVGNTNLVQMAPFTPTRKLVLLAMWEANDPLVHALPEHLKDVTNDFTISFLRPLIGEMPTNHTIGHLNSRYNPWRGFPGKASRPEDADPMIKDWGVLKPNDFDFPSGPTANVRWLDRIHRGTPWQTLYFERGAAPPSIWRQQFLDSMSHPTNDWKIIEYLRSQLTYSGDPVATRALNNTIVGNSGGGVLIVTNGSAAVMNNVVAHNSAGVLDEGGGGVEFSRNCVFGNVTHNAGDVLGSPQFVEGGFSVIATSPLIDAGNPAALGWIERNVLGRGIDIGALEFGPDGVPMFTLKRTEESECELELRGYPGQSYVIEASTNLTQWASISTNIAEMGTLVFTDAQGTNYSHRFYRARTP